MPVERNHATDRATMAGWDLRSCAKGKFFTLEVKYDLMEAKTGNVAVEHYNTKSGHPSGITATKADLWVYVFSTLESHVCRASSLRDYLRDVPPKRSVNGGDGNAALALYERDAILDTVFVPLTGELEGLLAGLLA